MSVEILWYILLGFLLVGYLVLDGYDYGIGILLPVLGRGNRRRRVMLNAAGPFLLGNEVWLIAVASVLVAAFPFMEAALFAAFYPLVVGLLAGLMLRGVGVQLRRFGSGAGWRSTMDAMTIAGSLLPALSWGMLVGGLLRGTPFSAGEETARLSLDLLHPFALLTGVASVALFATHGAMFLAMRLNGDMRVAAQRTAARMAPAALALVGGVVAVGLATTEVSEVLSNGGSAIAVVIGLVAALAAAWVMSRRGATKTAFGLSSAAVVAPAALIAAGTYPGLVVARADTDTSITLANGMADPTTLVLLAWFMVPLIPIVLASQIWNWWTFRRRIDERSALYF